MIWIAAGAFLISFFSIRAYLNNKEKYRGKLINNFNLRLYFYFLQSANIILIVSGIALLMLSIVSYVNEFEIVLSSEFNYHVKINSK